MQSLLMKHDTAIQRLEVSSALMVKLWQMVGAVALVALGAWLTAMLAGVPDVPKSFINALCRRLLRDDLTTEERADVGRLIGNCSRPNKTTPPK